MLTYSIATRNDPIESLLAIVQDFCDTCECTSLDIRYTKSFIEAFIDSSNEERVVLLVKDGSTPIGMLAANLSYAHPLYHSKPIATEVFFWVYKHYHNTKAARNLVKLFHDWGKTVGAGYYSIGRLPALEKSEIVDKWYKKMGYRVFEISYIKEIT